MNVKIKLLTIAVAGLFAAAAPATAAIIEIGGEGAISTNDSPYGELGLLDGGEVATAIFGFVVTPTATGATLTLTVTNTSPAVLGTESPDIPDAPVISDLFFGVPSAVETITFVTAGGVDAALTGWDFSFAMDGEPATGFGFLKSVFDVGMEGGPGADAPDPVIASIFDPVITDEPGDPLASPLDFVFALTFDGGVWPAGFSADWFCDPFILGCPDFIAAAKFISGANGGSGTVTNVIPEPASIVALVGGLLAAGAYRARKKRSGCETG